MTNNRNNSCSNDSGKEETILADFLPTVESVEEIHDVSDGTVVYRFNVSTVYKNRRSKFVVSNLDKIDFFKEARIPTHGLKGIKKDLLIKRLQEDAAICEPRIIYEVDLGFFLIEEVPVYNFGGHIIVPSSCGLTIRSKVRANVKIDESMLNESQSLIRRALDFSVYTPNVSVIIFYFLVLTVLKPVIKDKYLVNFVPFVTAPHGHGKTAILRKMLFIDSGRMVSFSSNKNKRQREKMLIDNCGLSVLADDLKPLKNAVKKQQQEDRLDDYTRWISFAEADYGTLVISGEYVDGIASCIDRLFIIEMDKITEQEKQKRKSCADSVSDYLFSTLAYYICAVIVEKYFSVMHDIDEFMAKPTEIVSDGAPKRFYEYIKQFKMAEYFFKKYFVGENEKMSHKVELEVALYKQAKAQSALLDKLDSQETVYDGDVILDFYEAFGKAIENNKATIDRDYFFNGYFCAYVQGNRIWTTDVGITEIMTDHLGFIVEHELVIKNLKRQYMLLHDEGRIKKKLERSYFYCINLPKLVEYGRKHGVNDKEINNLEWIVPKHVNSGR